MKCAYNQRFTGEQRMNTVKIERDTGPQNPRDWDNMGVMVAFHGRYVLGDSDHGYKSSDYSGWVEMEKAIAKDNPGCIILPLFLYDHSGITIATTSFNDRWDSGQVGFIFASLAKIRECYGVKRVTAKVRERALASLRSEVGTYDDYLTGDVYGYILEDEDGNEGDSCWGFYGSDPFKNGIADSIGAEYHEQLRAL
jgi:hypothetical protein